MSRLVPKIDRASLILALKSALVGCLIFGSYGAIQDQITFSISREYFTLLKFDQFAWAHPGFKNSLWFVAVIGFIAAGGGGAISGWVLARIAISSGKPISVRGVMRDFWLCPVGALTLGLVGFLCGRIFPTPKSWLEWMDGFITNQRGFADVGMIHNFSYVGAISGLVIAAILLKKRLSRLQKNGNPA